MKILINIFYTVEDVYGKVLLSFNSISPYSLLFYRGIGVTIITLLFFVILIFVEIPDENGEKSCIFTRYWKIFDNKVNILYSILVTITNFFYNVNIYFIIDKFSPTHYAMATILDSFGSLLISIFSGDIEIAEFFMKLILYLILIFVGLIYNEIIIFNCFGLQKNTKLFLEKEANMDISQTIIKNQTIYENDSDTEKEIIKQEGMKNAIKLKDISDKENDVNNIQN